MTTPVAPTYEELALSNAQLQAEVAKLLAPKPPTKTQIATEATSKGLKKFLASLAAAFTTPDAIKAEKSLLTIALTRLVILLPSAAIVLDIILKSLGAPSVGNP
jgi:hypothetical protein